MVFSTRNKYSAYEGRSLVMLQFGSLITAMITPFSDDGSVDLDCFGRLADGLIGAGNDSLLVSGTTGESPVLTEAERADLYREAVNVSSGRAKVIAGTGGYNTAESIHLSKLAASCGVDGLLQVAPYYNKPPQEGLYKHFTAIANSTDLPNILYNVPSRTVTNITASTVARLAEVDNIVGIKEASADFDQIAEIIRLCSSEFAVYSGNDGDTFPMLALGGVGVISVASHVVSGEIARMIALFYKGDLSEARQLHLDLLPIFRILFPPGWSNPIAVKEAVNLAGFSVGKPRLPLVELPDDMRVELDKVMKGYSLDSFLAPMVV